MYNHASNLLIQNKNPRNDYFSLIKKEKRRRFTLLRNDCSSADDRV